MELLTCKSTFAIANMELEQGLGHINASLEVLDVVQDTQQDLFLYRHIALLSPQLLRRQSAGS